MFVSEFTPGSDLSPLSVAFLLRPRLFVTAIVSPCPPSFQPFQFPLTFRRLVAEWAKDIDFNDSSWTVELEMVYLYWIMYQHCDSHNILRNVSTSFPFVIIL